jgi:ABC-type transport system substrate-binding protein
MVELYYSIFRNHLKFIPSDSGWNATFVFKAEIWQNDSLLATKKLDLGAAYMWYPVTKIATPDDYTVKIKFSKPYGAFLNLLTEPLLAPISPTAVEKWGPEYADHPTGTGPYMLGEYVKNDHLTLVRNHRTCS